jgi:hypothetical protein
MRVDVEIVAEDDQVGVPPESAECMTAAFRPSIFPWSHMPDHLKLRGVLSRPCGRHGVGANPVFCRSPFLSLFIEPGQPAGNCELAGHCFVEVCPSAAAPRCTTAGGEVRWTRHSRGEDMHGSAVGP